MRTLSPSAVTRKHAPAAGDELRHRCSAVPAWKTWKSSSAAAAHGSHRPCAARPGSPPRRAPRPGRRDGPTRPRPGRACRSRACSSSVEEIALQPHQDGLRLGIAQAAIEFQHLDTAVAADHQPRVEEARIGRAVALPSRDRGLDDIAHDPRVQWRRHDRRRRVSAHAARIGAVVAVEQAACGPGWSRAGARACRRPSR